MPVNYYACITPIQINAASIQELQLGRIRPYFRIGRGPMKEDSGNLWDYDAQYRVVMTNGIVIGHALVMGAGVALQARNRFPQLSRKLGKLVSEQGNVPYLLEQEGIITLPTKRHWKDKSDRTLIVSGITRLVALVNEHKISSVVMTRPGCGNGWLDWKDVKGDIEGLLDDRFTVLSGD